MTHLISKASRMRERGFTIVELLIVIVVIAILAAITIISYNGIQNRAKISNLSASLASITKKLELYKIENGFYPSALTDINIVDADSTTYQYSVNNTPDPGTFCVSATTGVISYRSDSQNKTVTEGPCTNFVSNPSFATTTTGWTTFAATGGSASLSRVATGGMDNGAFARLSISTPPSSGQAYITKGVGGADSNRNTAVEAGKTYTGSVWVRASFAAVLQMVLAPYDASNTATSGNSVTSVGTLVPNTWTRVSAVVTPGSGATTTVFRLQITNSTSMPTGATIDIDQAMLSQGSTIYPYND